MTTLIISPRFSPDNQALWQAAVKLGWNIHRAYRWQVPEDIECPVVYGEVAFCDVVAIQLDLALIEHPDDWLANLPHKYLLRNVWAMKLEDTADIEERKFFKPANDKVFLAGVYEKGSYVPYKHISPTCPCLVSDVVEFEIEIRCYIKGRELLTAAPYKWQGMVYESESPRAQATLQGAKKWVQYLLDDPEVELPPAGVIDVGFIPGQGWAVIEANQLYASGIYAGADCEAILQGLLVASGPAENTSADVRLKYMRRL